LTAIAQKQSSKTLVAYFSATGTTEKAAKVVAEVTGGTLYEIQPAKKYTSADLDWHDKSSRSSEEMADAKSRPTLSSKAENLADYDTVYIGFPIWWNLAPRIINTFIESGDFSGKTVILFATSGGSSISNSEKELQKTYSNLKWQKGKLLNGATKEDAILTVNALRFRIFAVVLCPSLMQILISFISLIPPQTYSNLKWQKGKLLNGATKEDIKQWTKK